jgi:hypothetical protein
MPLHGGVSGDRHAEGELARGVVELARISGPVYLVSVSSSVMLGGLNR